MSDGSQTDVLRAARIVCGVDGTRASALAAAQAVVLTKAHEATLAFVAITDARGDGPTAMATLSPERAREALDAARREAAEAGVDAEVELVHDEDVNGALLARGDAADLVVAGAPVGTRTGGILLGRTATTLLHRSRVPVMVARRPPDDAPFPQRLLVATDGSDGSDRAVELAASIARAHGAAVGIVHAGSLADAERRRRMSEQSVALADATGTEPTWIEEPEHGPDGIVAAARSWRAALLVVGARGVTGLRALGSVSERVAHQAPCSTLVARD